MVEKLEMRRPLDAYFPHLNPLSMETSPIAKSESHESRDMINKNKHRLSWGAQSEKWLHNGDIASPKWEDIKMEAQLKQNTTKEPTDFAQGALLLKSRPLHCGSLSCDPLGGNLVRP